MTLTDQSLLPSLQHGQSKRRLDFNAARENCYSVLRSERLTVPARTRA
jgi:hypothetical protein